MQSTSSAILASSPRGRAVHSLRGLIEKSGLRAGDRLPAESKLAAQFDVSRMTLRSAMEVLEREGLIRRQKNQGCFCATPVVPHSGLMGRTIVLLSDHLPASDGQLYSGSSASVVSGVIDHTGRQSLNFLRITPDTDDDRWLSDLIAAKPRGVIVSCWNRPIEWQASVLEKLSAAGLPVVTWGDSPALVDHDCVMSDHESGTRLLMNVLAGAGKKRILRLWSLPATTPWIQAHDRGYERAAKELGLEIVPAVFVEGLLDREPPAEPTFRIRVRQFAGYLAEHLNSKSPIDAIMVSTDCEAFVALAACRLFGRTDIPVTGYDNYWQTMPERQWEAGVPFATVDKGNHRLGEAMVELLMERVGATLPDKPQKRLVAQQLIVIK